MMKTFKEEIAQGRPRMALVALEGIIEELYSRIEVLENQSKPADTEDLNVAEVPEKAKPRKRAPAKKTVAKKEETAAG